MILLTLFASINEASNTTQFLYSAINDVQISKWQEVYQKKIYFGHRSVGNNIVDGIKDLIKANSHVKLNIVEPTDTFNSKVGFFMHSLIEQNASPQSIANDSEQLLNEKGGGYFDIVLLRFTPFYDKKEMLDIFADYKKTLSQLKKKYPKTILGIRRQY
jgi:hypothetical protein